MLSFTSHREAFLAFPPFPPWNLRLFTGESTLSSPFSRFGAPLCRQGAALAHLDPLLLMSWYSEQTALFLFVLARAALAYLPAVLSVALRPLFQQVQYAQVSLLKYTPFCKLFSGLGSINKYATSHLFSSYLTLVLSSPPYPLLHLSFHLKLSGISGRNCLFCPPVLSGYNGSPYTRFSRRTTRLMSCPDRERYLRPLQSLVVSLFLSLVSTVVLSRTGGVLSHRSSLTHRLPRFRSLTHRLPRFPPRKLC